MINTLRIFLGFADLYGYKLTCLCLGDRGYKTNASFNDEPTIKGFVLHRNLSITIKTNLGNVKFTKPE